MYFLENESILIVHSVKDIEITGYKNKIILCVKQKEEKELQSIILFWIYPAVSPVET